MRTKLRSCVMIFVLGAVGCSESTEAPALRALERSGKISLLCRDFASGEGRDMRACPDSEDSLNDSEDRRTVALVTQTLRGEVAVIDLHEEEVIDEDPYVSGIEFLPVGANPTSIVSTPGGVASFVGTAEPGLEAIFALPTTCITPPELGEPARDISLWSACRLPSAPGEMVIVVDPTLNGNDGYRTTCAPADATDWIAAAETPIDGRRDKIGKDGKDVCGANLESEQQTSPRGRRKLVVTLPDRGQIAIYDAQAILNLPPGSFDACVPDHVITLSSVVGTDPVEQPIPADLVNDASCEAAPPRYTAVAADPTATTLPAGIALSGTTLYVSDLGIPVIHRIDLTDPCAATEGEPLLPVSYNDPTRRVVTRDVAANDAIPSGKRYVYAIDDLDGSAMAFDVSAGATSRLPIVRSHVPFLPFEPADRIRFQSPMQDLLLVAHDVPAVTEDGTAEIGVLCDPNPDANEPGSLYRADEDYTEGAAPRKLRGLFGLGALSTGQIAAVDIEDWDAPCRRPVTNNPNTSHVDWLGCANDPSLAAGERYEIGSELTVTNEQSCNVSEPHRVRSGHFLVTDEDVGAYAANVSSLPILSGANDAAQRANNVERLKASPKMLAVPFTDLECSVGGDDENASRETSPYLFVGTTKYEGCALGQSVLPTDPLSAEQNSLLLPMAEPRVYTTNEEFTATFEGVVMANNQAGELPSLPADEVVEGLGRVLQADEVLLRDADAWFCDQGVQDVDVASGVGIDLGLSDADKLASFSADHGDFVVLMSDFDDDQVKTYFDTSGIAESCGVDGDLAEACEDWFGTADDPTGKRELVIREAYHNQLVLVPRRSDDYNRDAEAVALTIRQLHCCFPGARNYEVRAANQWVVRGARLLHDIVPGDNLRCVKDCSARYARLKNRVFEISSSADVCSESSEDYATCGIGAADTSDDSTEVCVLPRASGGVQPSELGQLLPPGCVFESLKGRFAIYRGLVPSVRDMAFTWTINGGFSGLSASMVSSTNGFSVMPEHMVYSESLDALVVVDGESGGVNLFGLGSFSSLGEPYL